MFFVCIFIEYYKIIEDSEDYMYIENYNEMTRLYVWFGYRQEETEE